MTVNHVSKRLSGRIQPAWRKLRCVSSGPMEHTCARRLSRGLTLMELIITMGIFGILIALAIPSYRYVTSSNRVAAEVNALVGDLQFARSEAIKEGQNVVVCAANVAGTNCLGTSGSTWTGGWIVFSDVNADQLVDSPTDTIFRVQSAFTGSDTLTSNNTINAISFNREGFASANGTGLSASSMMTLHTTPVVSSATRCLLINQVGLLTVQQFGGSCT
jgi:type IV fimbrial biogenesis protein FimT